MMLMHYLQKKIRVMVSWGCTIDKVQGVTLDKVWVSFTLSKQKSFGDEQKAIWHLVKQENYVTSTYQEKLKSP